jgi:hypothetical protein
MMENLGLGATLDFNSGPGLAGMEQAASGLTRLQGRFHTFRDNVGKVGASLDHLNMVAMGMGALGFAGVGEAIHKSFEARSEIEDMQIVLASTLQMTNKNIKEMGDFSNQAGTAMGIAADQMELIEINAAQAPGESRDLLGIYKQILGPMTAAGQSLDRVQSVTKGAAIAAQALGIPFQDMAFSMDRLISGSVREQDMLFRSLKSQKLITESAGEWAALPQAERLKRINALMDRYGKNADLIGSTWSAMMGTISSIVKMFGSSFVTPLFDAIKQVIQPITETFLGAANVSDKARLEIVKHWKEVAKQAGEKLVPAFKFFVEVLKQVWQNMQRAWETGEAFVARLRAMVPHGEGFHRMAVNVGAIAIALAGVLPMLSLVKSYVGPVVSIFRLAVSAAGMIGPVIAAVGEAIVGAFGFLLSGPGLLLLPFIGALVGAFSLLRHENESWGQTAARIWTDSIMPGWESFKATVDDIWSNYVHPFITSFGQGFGVYIPEILSTLQDAWFNLRQAFSLLFDQFSGDLGVSTSDAKEWGRDIGGIVGGVVNFFSTVVRTFTGVVGTVIYVAAQIKEAFSVMSTNISTFFFNAVVGVTNVVKGIHNAIAAPIRGVLSFLGDALMKLNRSTMVRKAMSAMGIDLASEAATFSGMAAGWGKWEYADAGHYDKMKGEAEDDYFRKRRGDGPLKKKAAETKPIMFDAEIIDRSHRCVENTVKVNVDGSAVAAAQARYQTDLKERAGAGDNSYQRRQVALRSAATTRR